jgi:hypothetical protein
MIKLIRNVLGILFVFALGFNSYGQRRVLVPVQPYRQQPPRNANRQNGAGKKMQAVKENYIGQRLKLTPKEATAFWPLYREYSQKLTAVRILKRINNSSSTVDGSQQVDKDLEYETQLVDIKKHYKDEFYKILPPEKVSELYKSEREFNDEALRILSEQSVRAGN